MALYRWILNYLVAKPMFVPYQWPQVNGTNMKNNVNAIVWNEVVNVFNSLAPGGFDYSLKLVHFKLI